MKTLKRNVELAKHSSKDAVHSSEAEDSTDMNPDLSKLDALNRKNSGQSHLQLSAFDGEIEALMRLPQEGADPSFCSSADHCSSTLTWW